jgi:hypothetical protein
MPVSTHRQPTFMHVQVQLSCHVERRALTSLLFAWASATSLQAHVLTSTYMLLLCCLASWGKRLRETHLHCLPSGTTLAAHIAPGWQVCYDISLHVSPPLVPTEEDIEEQRNKDQRTFLRVVGAEPFFLPLRLGILLVTIRHPQGLPGAGPDGLAQP